MKAYAGRVGAVYLDYYSAMVDDRQGLRSDLTYDGVHPTEAGYRVMAPLAEQAIEEALRTPGGGDSRAEIDAFNRALDDATRHMDNAATLALWDDDGVSLLPAAPPIVGKKAIASFLEDVTAKHPGGRMQSFTLDCSDVQVTASSASEWCTEHQVVTFADGNRFDGRGKMLLVLRRGADGKWRLHDEMWNQGE
jgi:uncharacterized protein (TIGR02246 family)